MGALDLPLAMMRYGYPRRGSAPRKQAEPPRCRYCGDKNVYWMQTQAGWRLHSTWTHNPHSCRQYHEHKQRQQPRDVSDYFPEDRRGVERTNAFRLRARRTQGDAVRGEP